MNFTFLGSERSESGVSAERGGEAADGLEDDARERVQPESAPHAGGGGQAEGGVADVRAFGGLSKDSYGEFWVYGDRKGWDEERRCHGVRCHGVVWCVD